MSKQIIDSVQGVTTLHHYDETEDRTVIERVQDVGPILEANKRAQNSGDEGWSASREYQKIAEIPMVVIEEWCKENPDFMNDFHKNLRKKLQDSENLYLKSISGRI